MPKVVNTKQAFKYKFPEVG